LIGFKNSKPGSLSAPPTPKSDDPDEIIAVAQDVKKESHKNARRKAAREEPKEERREVGEK
jgi:hypothetical protein